MSSYLAIVFILLCTYNAYVYSEGIEFPEDEIMEDTAFLTLGPYVFEGADYDMLPDNEWQHHRDCTERYIHCIEVHQYLNTVCRGEKGLRGAWEPQEWSLCEFENYNCLVRKESGRPPFGKEGLLDDKYFYAGEGGDCRGSDRINFNRRRFFHKLSYLSAHQSRS